MVERPFSLLRFEPRIKVLHLTWLAFFVSFLVWFNHAPLMAAIRSSLHLTDQQVSALLILNVALTIPARIVVGMLVDKLGPRLMFASLLAISGVLCIFFGLAQELRNAWRSPAFCLAFVGAGFVVGIRMIGEWFPAKETGLAQGIYAGFGNFGSAAAAVTLPTRRARCRRPRWLALGDHRHRRDRHRLRRDLLSLASATRPRARPISSPRKPARWK